MVILLAPLAFLGVLWGRGSDRRSKSTTERETVTAGMGKPQVLG